MKMFHFDSCGKQHMLKYVKKFKAMQHLSLLVSPSLVLWNNITHNQDT